MQGGSYVPPVLTSSSLAGSVATSVAESKLQHVGLKTQNEEGKRKQAERTKWISVISTGFASITIVTAIVAMYIEASVIAYVAFAFPLVTAPFAIRQRRKLHKLSTFEQQVNEIRVLVNDLTTENNQLQQENGKLEAQVAKLQHVQDEFQNLVQESGGDVRTMKELAKEYRSIQSEMQSLTKATKMQKFLQAIFRSDTNRNFELDSPQEIDLLVHRLKLIGNLDFDEGRLRDSIHNSDKKSLTTIYVVASGTLDEDDNGDGDVEMT